MIYALEGKLFSKSSNEVVINCNGVFYVAGISLNTFDKLPEPDKAVFVFSYMQSREDGIYLYAFHDINELELFKLLISISGIGPKSALGILSAVTPKDFRDILLSKDITKLTKFPGIGKKTAERVIFELGDKSLNQISKFATTDSKSSAKTNVDDAVAALTALGYNYALAEKTVRTVIKDAGNVEITTENIIKMALKHQLK